MAANRKLKILCLHGYRQDADAFRSKMGGFRKSIKNIAELTFITAPHLIQEDPSSNSNGNESENLKGGYSWWFCDGFEKFSSKTESKQASGFLESIDCVSKAFESQGPFDGILGFSQGGALAALICGLKEQGKFLHSFQFVIIIAGFKSLSSDHQYLYDKVINIPSLHIIGKSDTCISKDLSENLMPVFKTSSIIYHDGGHFVPSHSSIKKELKAAPIFCFFFAPSNFFRLLSHHKKNSE